eukprot:6420037-Prymnesium_polylepis.1
MRRIAARSPPASDVEQRAHSVGAPIDRVAEALVAPHVPSERHGFRRGRPQQHLHRLLRRGLLDVDKGHGSAEDAASSHITGEIRRAAPYLSTRCAL